MKLNYNDIVFAADRIAARRGDAVVKIESVAMSMVCTFGLADLTALLPAVANTFYIIKSLDIMTVQTQVTANVKLRLTNLAGGSAGNLELLTATATVSLQSYKFIECESMLYIINGNTAGSIIIVGEVYKVTGA
jgi:hypothetical protein